MALSFPRRDRNGGCRHIKTDVGSAREGSRHQNTEKIGCYATERGHAGGQR